MSYKNFEEMVEISGISKTEMLYHMNKGDVAWIGNGPQGNRAPYIVNEDDVLDLMIEKEKIMG